MLVFSFFCDAKVLRSGNNYLLRHELRQAKKYVSECTLFETVHQDEFLPKRSQLQKYLIRMTIITCRPLGLTPVITIFCLITPTYLNKSS
jgi:hypothetical protein